MPRRAKQRDVVFEPVTRSRSMRELDRTLRVVAPKDIAITLSGESGSGKEVLARRVHELSHRNGGPFIPINCAAIPETLFESELFGHEKGAFTGADDRARGKLEAADGGTLFLDEIGEMPLSVQAKLLRFLENRKFMRVGGTTKIAVDIRLVTATLKPLEEEVRAGRFRADLFYRIQGITLRVPSLRERQDDIGPLIQEFLTEAAVKHSVTPPRLTRAAMAALHAYAWPGNIRELKNLIELLSILREGKQARMADLPESIQSAVRDASSPSSVSLAKGADRLEVRLNQPLDDIVGQILRAALDVEGGNRSRAARRLSISLRTMQRHAIRFRKLDA